MATKSSSRTRSAGSSSSPPAKRQKTTVAPFAASFPRRTILSSSRWVNKIPHDIWVYKILNPFLDLKGLTTVGRCNTFFQEYWQYVLKQNVIRVPEGCPTMNQAMALAVVFSERNECTRENPVKVEVGEGEHAMVGVEFGQTNVTCSHITFVGKGKNQTTINGGFRVDKQQHVTFEELAITNQSGSGLICHGSGTNVDVLKCAVKVCRYFGMCVYVGATVTATGSEFMENGHGVHCFGTNTKARLTDCTMHHNVQDGLFAFDHAVVDLHGTKTDIHSNKRHGIRASGDAKVNIHLPSQHNTCHDNVGDDRHETSGGSIANINADGTFTHVVVDEHDGWVTE